MSQTRKTPAGHGTRPSLPLLLTALAVILVAVNLRPGASSVGPVLAELQAGLGIGATAAGVLTALPGLTFAVVGALAVAISRKAGINGSILLALAAIAAGLLLRSLVNSAALFLLLTVLAFAGMAVGNILVPAFIKRHGGARLALMNSIYGTTLALGATLPLLLGGVLAGGDPNGWRLSLGIWGAAALVAFVPWTLVAVKTGRDVVAGEQRQRREMKMRSSRTAVALSIFFGVQSMHAYVQFGWAAQIYRDAGLEQGQAGLMAAIIAALGIPGGLIMPALVARSSRLRFYIAGLGVLMLAGYTGLLLAPATLPWLWALCLGLAGFAFPTALALITARSREPRTTARLSGFIQPVGYLLAALGPFAIGALHDVSGSWTLPLAILLGSAVVMVGAGIRAAAPVYVDDELETAQKAR
ncbi:MFS transporter [Arthrobacter sp. zg-Y20]|uniref:MFS transporter n=1 Tax=unclassified Arthrobacter TaxID=235627 RepID=UPI001D1349DB|nr:MULTISPECIES: MFS transporter [unclassified Arthrobacter]MCC3276703.1 MFS transporter [Arthrobacter sp. zg-Y20]MDK1316862.1 MFS transporter [Arthrobacter sp. zg.Y20]WIB06727.1 MFS transporter [Arthrobacter sp. zg-Y20]